MKKRRILIVMISFFFLFFSTGCWNRFEINEKAIVAGVGIDRTKEIKNVEMTVQVVLPGGVKAPAGGGGIGKAVWIADASGSSVFDTIRNFSLQSGRKLLWSHNQVLVIGEEAAKQGVDEIIDIFERGTELRRRIWVLVAKGDAKNVMNANTKIDKVPAFGISGLIKAGGFTSKVVQVNVHEFLGMISSENTCAYVPGIEVFNEDKDKGLRLSDTAIFKDYKLRGWLNQNETRGLLWILGEVKSGIIDVRCPSDQKTPISLEISKASSKIKPQIIDGEILIKVEINEEGIVGATPIPTIDLSKTENIKKIEKIKEEAIEEEIAEAIEKARGLNTDIFGFGEAIYRKYPDEWKKIEEDWNEIFPQLEVEVDVNAKIRRTGLVTKPAINE